MATIIAGSGRRMSAVEVSVQPQPLGRSASWLIGACAAVLLAWVLGMGFVISATTAAAGDLPAASLAIGWPLAAIGAVAVWMNGRSFWRLVGQAGWAIVFPILTPHYFDAASRVGLFLGRVPNLETATMVHALAFFALPSLATGMALAWATGSRLMLVLGLLAAGATTLQVCICGHHAMDNPLLQVWVWNAVMLLGVACFALAAWRKRVTLAED
jgi:hypothetical protein